MLRIARTGLRGIEPHEPITKLGRTLILLSGDGFIEFANEVADEKLTIDRPSRSLRRLAGMMRSAVLSTLDQGRELIFEGLVALWAAENACLAKLRKAQAASGAGLLCRRRCDRCRGAMHMRQDDLGKNLLHRRGSGNRDAGLLSVMLTKMHFLGDLVLHRQFVHDGRFVAEIAFHGGREW